jgi:hypothetical protein
MRIVAAYMSSDAIICCQLLFLDRVLLLPKKGTEQRAPSG